MIKARPQPWYGNKTVPPWYEPRSGVEIGSGPGYSGIYCFGCHSWIDRACSTREWPALVRCRCGQMISTRRPAGQEKAA